MSERAGFDPGWLRLREPYDHAARATALTTGLAQALGGCPRPWRLLDLGCGTGSSFRYLAPALGGPQRWTLVDHDPVLLARAVVETRRWAVRRGLAVRPRPDGLAVGDWALRCRRLDLRGTALAPAGAGPWDAVVTSALLDLVSLPWLASLADACAAQRLPLLAALTVDGRLRWEPEDPDDSSVLGWFREHQHTDRGFGASPGPLAAEALAALLTERGFQVQLAPADWQIHASDPRGPELLGELAKGLAAAAQQLSPTPARVERWLQRRLAGAGRGALTVGHQDLLALPGA